MGEALEELRLAILAAVSVAEGAGYSIDDPRVVADSNHTIVWLRPHEAIAKVGRPSADEFLIREHAVGTALARLGAPIAPPLAGLEPTRDANTGLLVTLWQRFVHGGEDDVDPEDVGKSLLTVHDALNAYRDELPSFLDKLETARAVLSDDRRISALGRADRRFLRTAFDSLVRTLDSRHYSTQRLHGEPHSGNYLATETGVRWIDFEGTCVGPLEWDLAFLPTRSLRAFRPPDDSLLELLRTLNSARTATLCWERYDVPALRWHAEFRLEQVRRRTAG